MRQCWGDHGHTTDQCSVCNNSVNEPLRSFTVAGEGPRRYLFGIVSFNRFLEGPSPGISELREGPLTALMETHHDHTRSCYDSHKHRYGRPTSTSVFLDNSNRKNFPSVDKMCQLLLLLFF